MKKTIRLTTLILIFAIILLAASQLINHPDEVNYKNAFYHCSNLSLSLDSLFYSLSYNPHSFYAPGYYPILCLIGLTLKKIELFYLFQIALFFLIIAYSYKTKKYFFLSLLLLPSMYIFSISLLREIWMFSFVFLFINSLHHKSLYARYLLAPLSILTVTYFRIPLGIALFIYGFYYHIFANEKLDKIPHIEKFCVTVFLVPLFILISLLAPEIDLDFLANYLSVFTLDTLGLTSLKNADFSLRSMLNLEKYILAVNFYLIWMALRSFENFKKLFPYLACYVFYWTFYYLFWRFGHEGAPEFGYRNFFPLIPLFLFSLRDEISRLMKNMKIFIFRIGSRKYPHLFKVNQS